ncbi:MAG TPA: LLM class flavin-dependent oxidoreductase [Polyangia bacterium]|nr:LLM class flavin-dependent oxidoreductase [Polyangia bacterium]
MTPLSLLDLAPIVEGADAAQAFRNSVDLARHAERWGYRRFWLAEHHNMPGVASAATSIAIAHVAAATSTIRVGAGGIMLPNHAPLVIAEQFGTLDALAPGRIDLGLGRAPGTDPETAYALRRTLVGGPESFPGDVEELLDFLRPAVPGQRVRAVPGAGADVEIWILGSSLFGAELAGKMGLPFAFASHFAPALLDEAAEIYRRTFRPSERLERPRLMVGTTVVAADTDGEAALLLTSLQQAFVNLRGGRPTQLPPPVPGYAERLAPQQAALLDGILPCAAVGAPATVQSRLRALRARTDADELILTSQIFDHTARLRSFEIAAGLAI